MKGPPVRIAITLVALAVASQCPAADDEKYASAAGKYAVTFPPGKVKETSSRTKGNLPSDQSIIEVKGRTFEVIYFELTDELRDLGAKTLYDRGEKGAIGEKGKLVFSADFAFGPDKIPAREVAVRNGELMDRALMILKGNRLYAVTVRGPDSFTTSKEAYAFFDSFQLTK